MPNVPKTHQDNQNSLCALCLEKSKHLRNITDTRLEQIRKFGVFEDYNKTKEECGKDWTWYCPNGYKTVQTILKLLVTY